MKPQARTNYGNFDDHLVDAEGLEETSEDDLWFLPGPMEVEPDYICRPDRGQSCVKPQSSTIGGRQRQAIPPISPVWLAGLARWMTVCTVARTAGGTGSR